MRKGGENVSAYEVEQVIKKHDAIEDAAVYAVPSELAEDEIMTAVKIVEGMAFDPAVLLEFLSDKLARFAIPRYIRQVEDLPMTNSHRIIKGVLEKDGITKDTFDARKSLGEATPRVSDHGKELSR
jgi:crotonobetaine/carnitine-CoA ligase